MPEVSAGPLLEVLDPGLLTTIQDAGRPGFEHLGVPHSGAADRLALAAANLLVGNPPGAAALECTLLGPRLRVLRSTTIAFAGVDLGAEVHAGRRRLEPLAAHPVAAGGVIECVRAGTAQTGCRAYLAVAGGIDVPEILGSRSTSLVGAFGGFDGRALRSDDVLSARVGPTSDARTAERAQHMPRRWPADVILPSPADPIRVLPMSDGVDVESPREVEAFLATTWTVEPDSDRRGLRLRPSAGDIEGIGGWAVGPGRPAADRPSRAVVPGTIQLTPAGRPLILMPDAGTTGGYPVIAVVISADLPVLGQLAPRSTVRFEAVDLPGARAAIERQRSALAEVAVRLRATDPDRDPGVRAGPDQGEATDAGSDAGDRDAWDELWRDARG
jgi:biotin-dependent carboxylase-like uncharacterized protein